LVSSISSAKLQSKPSAGTLALNKQSCNRTQFMVRNSWSISNPPPPRVPEEACAGQNVHLLAQPCCFPFISSHFCKQTHLWATEDWGCRTASRFPKHVITLH